MYGNGEKAVLPVPWPKALLGFWFLRYLYFQYLFYYHGGANSIKISILLFYIDFLLTFFVFLVHFNQRMASMCSF